MTFFQVLLVWLISFVFTSLIDAFWHLGVFRRIYAEGMKPLARTRNGKMTFNALTGILAQVLVVTCIVFLVLYKVNAANFLDAALIGAAAGALAITVYGLTNYSLLKDWKMSLTILEVVWGPILGGLTGVFTVWIKSLLIK